MNPIIHNPNRLLGLLERDYLSGPNWYHLVRNKLHKALRTQRAVRFELQEPTHYGAQVLVTIDGQTQPITKGKLRWRELEFYGLYPQTTQPAGIPVAQAA